MAPACVWTASRLPVGMLPELPPHQRTIQLPAESRLLIASDGVFQASEMFCKRVIDTVADFTQDRAQSDDMTRHRHAGDCMKPDKMPPHPRSKGNMLGGISWR